jgi:hypothetical protein
MPKPCQALYSAAHSSFKRISALNNPHPSVSFNQAMYFLSAKHGNAICEDLVQSYCQSGLLKEEGEKLILTEQGKAQLVDHRKQLLS